LQIYELLGMAGEFGGSLDWVKCYEAGLAAWRARDFTAGIAAFEKVLAIRPDDAASSAMIQRCKQQLENPGTEDWDGTTVARTK
jgi:adenylate cyclase